jgi:hypothetical protein
MKPETRDGAYAAEREEPRRRYVIERRVQAGLIREGNACADEAVDEW